MGYILDRAAFTQAMGALADSYAVHAPKRLAGKGRFSDTDAIRYGRIERAEEIILDEKPSCSFKEALLPIVQTLFHFTEDHCLEPAPSLQDALILLRSCELHAVKRLDEIHLNNGPPDYYYERWRSRVKFALIGCPRPFDNCFCVDMGANVSDNYAFSINSAGDVYGVDVKDATLREPFRRLASREEEALPAHVTETKTKAAIPRDFTLAEVISLPMWDAYDARCVGCGRCNFACPTCSCHTVQDIFYADNAKNGERRRVWASCMADGYTDVAGGGSYRTKFGQRMRYKILHKILDFKQRFGYWMCTGCGLCDDVCPEYISFPRAIAELGKELGHAGK